MKKLLTFAIVLTFIAQASLSFASSALIENWGGGGTSSLSNIVFSGTGEYNIRKSMDSNGQLREGIASIYWGQTGTLLASQFLDAQYNHVSGLSHGFQSNPGASDLVSFDYNLAINFTNAAAPNMSGTMHFDYMRSSDRGIFILSGDDLKAFSKTFVVDGILYESSLEIATLSGTDLTMAQKHLGVGADVQLFGWVVTSENITRHTNFDLNIVSYGNAPVPVPGAIWLLGSGLAGIMSIKRRNSLK